MVNVGETVRAKTHIMYDESKPAIPKGLMGRVVKECAPAADGSKQLIIKWALGDIETAVFEDEVAVHTPVATFDSNNVKIGTGSTDKGAFHRALVIARELFKRGVWDGSDEIFINNAQQTHDDIFGIGKRSIDDLVEGVDFEFCEPTTRAAEYRPTAPAQMTVIEIKTLVQVLHGGAIALNDAQLAEYLNQGWEIINLTVAGETVEAFPTRFITLRRDVDVAPVEPERVAEVKAEKTPTPSVETPPAAVPVEGVIVEEDEAMSPVARDWAAYERREITLEELRARGRARLADTFFEAMETLNGQRRVLPQLLCEVVQS